MPDQVSLLFYRAVRHHQITKNELILWIETNRFNVFSKDTGDLLQLHYVVLGEAGMKVRHQGLLLELRILLAGVA